MSQKFVVVAVAVFDDFVTPFTIYYFTTFIQVVSILLRRVRGSGLAQSSVTWVRFRPVAFCGLSCCWSSARFFSNISKFQFDQDIGPS